MNLDITVDNTALTTALKKSPEVVVGHIRKWVNRTATRVVNKAVVESPVKTGDLNRSISANYAKAGLEAEVRPSSKHALYVHEGTGIYGPKKRPITPTSKQALAFSIGGHDIVVKSIKGQRKNQFMNRAYKAIKPEADKDASKTLETIVRSI